MEKPSATIERYRIEESLDRQVLALQRWKQDDRFCHQVRCSINDVEQLLLSAVEGSDQDVWPPSPPLQQV